MLKTHVPTHVCAKCREWWFVYPMGQDMWMIVSCDGDSSVWNEHVAVPACPCCRNVVLDQWLIDD